MAWQFYGEYLNDLRKEVAGVLTPPSTVAFCALGTESPISLYDSRDPSSANPIPNGSMSTGVQIGSAGVDIIGNAYFYAQPGRYTPIIDGVTYPPITVYPDVDDLAALGGASTSSSGRTLQLLTASTRSITNQSNIASGVTLGDWGWALNPGDVYRFDGCLFPNSTRPAGFKLQCQASGTGVVMGYVMRGPHVAEWNQYDVTEHRDTTVTSASNGPQSFGGFAATGSSDSYVEIIGGYVALPSSAPAPGAVTWKFAQASPTSDTTTVKDMMSALSVVKLS